jgi:hypothetical protein
MARGEVLLVLPALAANLDRDVDHDDVDDQADPEKGGAETDVLDDGFAGCEDEHGWSLATDGRSVSWPAASGWSAGVVALTGRRTGECKERCRSG